MKTLLQRIAFCNLFLLIFFHSTTSAWSQCTNTALGAYCAPGAFNTTSLVLSADLGTTNKTYTNIGVGYNYLWATYLGGCYTIASCGAGIDNQIGIFSPTTGMTTPFAYDDDNGPSCTGTAASVDFVSNYSGNITVTYRQYNCATTISSVSTTIRQNNNLVITSSNADMCAGSTRTLTATPTPVGSSVAGAGNPGAFSGTGVAGTTFTAPVPAGASATYTITYTFGYCSTTQNINVYRAPLGSITTPSQTICASSLALAATTTYGSGTWTASDAGVTFSPNNTTANATANNLPVGTTTLTWTVTNGPCAAAVYTINVTRYSGGPGQWLGVTNTDWNTASNWCGGVPTNTTDVLIPDAATTAFDPHVTSTTAVCRDITLAANSLFYLDAGQTLTVYRDWINNTGNTANVTASANSTLAMNNTNGNIGGTTATTFNNFTNSSVGGYINVNQPTTVTNTLTMNGNFNLNSNLILGTAPASAGTLTMGGIYWIIGPAYFRRYFNNTTNTAAQGLFPFGQVPGAYRRDATVMYTGAPSSGGYIDGRFVGTPLTLYTGLPIWNDAGVNINNYMNEGYWEMIPGGGLSGGNYTMQLQYDGITTITNASTLRIIKSPGPAHTNWVADGTHGTVSGTTTAGYVTRTGMSGFSWFVISSSSGENPLPVELTNMNATCGENSITVEWTTATETNSDYFAVERSADGITWIEAGRINAAGNSNEAISYSLVDNAPLNGYSYYRLTQADKNGDINYFDPIAIQCMINGKVTLLLYPNPTSDVANVKLYTSQSYNDGVLSITDVAGRTVMTQNIRINAGENIYTLGNVATMQPGIYHIRISGGDEEIAFSKLVIK